MIGGRKVLVVVPARGGSKGLPRKNVIMLHGKPLVAWPIGAAKASKFVDRVIVSTDDAEVAAAAAAAGAEVPFMRPEKIAGDSASSMDVLRHAIDSLAANGDHYEYVLLLEPTSPLTEAEDIDKALELLHGSLEIADSVVGVSRVEAAHPEYDVKIDANGLISPFMAADFSSLRRRQEIAELYFMEGSVYVSTVSAFLAKNSFYHDRTLGYVVPRWKSLEVDDYFDLVCIEAVLAKRDEIKARESHAGLPGQ